MIFPPIPLANYAQMLAVEALAARIKPFAPASFSTGGETWFEGSGAFVCPDQSTWTKVWDRHIQNESIGNVGVGNLNPAPAVDFNRNLVVALFGGPTAGVVGYRALSGYAFGNQAFLRLVPVVDNSSGNAVALPSPWAFLVLPRTHGTVSIQMPRNGVWATVVQVKPSL